MLIYVLYLLLAFLVVFISIKLSCYVDLLDKTTNVSGALLGGAFLAMVTSLPELFTSISSVSLLGEEKLVMGNILGSNLFNLAVLGVLFIVFFKGYNKSKINKSHVITLLCTLAMFGISAYAVFAKNQLLLVGINVISFGIVVFYIIALKKMSGDEEKEDFIEYHLSTKQIISRFIILSILLVGTSVAITYVSDEIAIDLGLGKTVAGALLLGVATSLPELSSSLSLCKMGNFNASTGNIVGSNSFNFLILVIAELLSFKTSIFTYDSQTRWLIIFGVCASIFTLIVLIIKNSKFNKLPAKITTLVLCFSIVASYISFVVLSMI